MQLIKVVDQALYFSNTDGSDRKTIVNVPIDVVAAKHASAYVEVLGFDTNARLSVGWQHSPDGKLWVNTSSSHDLLPVLDVQIGMYAKSGEKDVTFAAQIRINMNVGRKTGPAAMVQVRASVWVALKPF